LEPILWATVSIGAVQRTILILLCVVVSLGIMWCNMEPILLLCGQDKSIINLANSYINSYIVCSLPYLITQVFLHHLRIYLRTQNITQPLLCSTGIALFFHVPLNFQFSFNCVSKYEVLRVASCSQDLTENSEHYTAATMVYSYCSFFFMFHSIFNRRSRGVALAAVTNFNMVLALIRYLYLSGAYKKSSKCHQKNHLYLSGAYKKSSKCHQKNASKGGGRF
jgi:hypothetical protein